MAHAAAHSAGTARTCEGASVTDTAIRLGWANPSSFIEAFTELVGQTPGRYHSAARAAHD
ncbi:hypothetical protein [Nonomuraea insulae]|uniref:HTH araC/xylS-type domain-containing protein n=1 Tax=Nonomuraea insulae TaxID=1616787 RepID=A0ABW1CEK1_9ACTN